MKMDIFLKYLLFFVLYFLVHSEANCLVTLADSLKVFYNEWIGKSVMLEEDQDVEILTNWRKDKRTSEDIMDLPERLKFFNLYFHLIDERKVMSDEQLLSDYRNRQVASLSKDEIQHQLDILDSVYTESNEDSHCVLLNNDQQNILTFFTVGCGLGLYTQYQADGFLFNETDIIYSLPKALIPAVVCWYRDNERFMSGDFIAKYIDWLIDLAKNRIEYVKSRDPHYSDWGIGRLFWDKRFSGADFSRGNTINDLLRASVFKAIFNRNKYLGSRKYERLLNIKDVLYFRFPFNFSFENPDYDWKTLSNEIICDSLDIYMTKIANKYKQETKLNAELIVTLDSREYCVFKFLQSCCGYECLLPGTNCILRPMIQCAVKWYAKNKPFITESQKISYVKALKSDNIKYKRFNMSSFINDENILYVGRAEIDDRMPVSEIDRLKYDFMERAYGDCVGCEKR